MHIKKKDLMIIAQLRQNSRMPLTKMSRSIKIPVSTIFDKLKVHENQLIIKHTSLIDFEKIGYHARANIMIKVDKSQKEDIRKFLIYNDAVNSLYKINNGYDFIIEGIFKDIKDLDNFFEDMESKFNIKDKQSYFIIEDLKRESFMSNYNLVQ